MSTVASISKIRSKYLLLRWTETILFGLAGGVIAAAICLLVEVPVYLSVFATIAIIAWRYYSLALSKVDELKLALYINRFYPELKESSDLLVKDPESLTVLEEIQLSRINLPKVKLPHNLWQSIMAVIGGLTVLLVATALVNIKSQYQFEAFRSKPEVVLDPSIKSVIVTIAPPSYTRLSKHETDNLNFSAVEGSQIVWSIEFHQPVQHIKLTITGGDSIVVKEPKQKIEFRYTLATSVLYRLTWTISGESHSSDYYRIDVKADAAPQVSIKELPQFTRMKWGEKNSINVVSDIADDYGLSQAHVIATVSKGSGESVKFREEKLLFISPSNISGTNVTGKLAIDFHKLGMDPGDEVYFYVEAFDNKQPQAQRNRTDTYFVALQDTAQQEMVMDEGLSVDMMPDYFRSQRQLIIDTEKLLADQKAKKVTKQQFNSTSNELGYDQKVLRLRYGQFLGEEFENNMGESEAEHTEHVEGEKEEADDILKRFGHQHDTENEHNLVEDKKPEAGHEHDNTDQATFFTLSIKAKLRAALTLMWDSELKLRMYQPKESLPVQYQALKLLKEISQDSRIYVHRMGFDPPPIKEDKRLTGSLDEVKPAGLENKATIEFQYPAIRLALSDLSNQAYLHAAGEELAAIALNSPGNFLQTLSDIKSIEENKFDSTDIPSKLKEIQKAFWTILPNEASSPTQRSSGAHALDLKFLEEIKTKAND